MRNHAKIFVLAALGGAGSLLTAQAQTIADWTFESSLPAMTNAAAGPYSPEVGSGSATGLHASAATVYSHPSGNGSAASFSANTWAIGDYYQFQVSTLGYNDIVVSFDQASSNTGPGAYQLQYSTDGSTFTTFTSYTVLANAAPNTTWNPTTYNSAYTFTEDMSSVSAIDNAATVYFRLVDNATTSANGGTIGTGGTDRVDNFDVSDVPEPTTVALGVLGGLAFVAARRRKH